jgi:hypothetical protein
MIRNRKFAIVLALGAVIATAVIAARAQMSPAPMVRAKPLHTSQPKPAKGRFEVLHMFPTAIQVRSLTNQREIHTFTYSDQIRDKMQKLLDKGGYQYGDIVEIEYRPGTDIAVKIKGKPSKPL